MSVFCSRCPPLFGPADDLFRGALHVLRQHLDRRMPTLRQHLAVGQLSIAALGEAAMAERGERQLIAQDSGADDFFDLAAQMCEVRLIWFRPCRPRSAVAPIPAQHQTARFARA